MNPVVKVVLWIIGGLSAVAFILLLLLVIGSMVGVIGDVLGWWDGWVSDA